MLAAAWLRSFYLEEAGPTELPFGAFSPSFRRSTKCASKNIPVAESARYERRATVRAYHGKPIPFFVWFQTTTLCSDSSQGSSGVWNYGQLGGGDEEEEGLDSDAEEEDNARITLAEVW